MGPGSRPLYQRRRSGPAFPGLRSRQSSPRLMVYDTSLFTWAAGASRRRCLEEPGERGHLIESAVGAALLARSKEEGFEVYWWRDRDKEVDFVVEQGRSLTAV
ncbi:MAG: DUF4143 domain-containing protein, partial [Treponema sp.]|nr:DUF4143 domain-containing protein [Treponema sp.]